jgi:hypothetical protein
MHDLVFLTWESVTQFANSNFTTSLLGAGFGALAGAWAAQRIADRAKLREQLLHEVQSTNTAIELAYVICNNYLNLKEQHVLPVQQRYDQQASEIDAHAQGIRTGMIPPNTELDLGLFDLRTLQAAYVPIDRLEQLVMEQLSVSGRPRPLVANLSQSVDTLNGTINNRNDLLSEYKERNLPLDAAVGFLFGLRRGNTIDTRFKDTVSALSAQTDNCIQFSRMLCADLVKHGETKLREFERLFGFGAPRIQRPVWDGPDSKGLFPPSNEFAAWDTSFLYRAPCSDGRHFGKFWYFVRKTFRRSRLGKLHKARRRAQSLPQSN